MNDKDKINVLILLDHLHIGGAETVVANLCRYLDRSMFNVKVCCIKEMGIVGEDLIKEGYEVFVLSEKAYSERKYSSSLSLMNLIRDQRIDIIHSHTIQSLIDGALCKIVLRNVGLIHTFHYGNYPNLHKKYLMMEKYLCRVPNRLVAVGNEQKSAIVNAYNLKDGRITTIWNGVRKKEVTGEDRIVKKYRRDERLIIGTVCTLIEQKGLTFLVDVANKLKQRNKDVIFLIAGEGNMRSLLEAKSKELGLEDNVVFLGWVDNAANAFIPFIDIFFLPSLWEAMSVVVLEAMEAGKPVVVTDVGESRHVIENGKDGFVVKAKNVSEMASILEKLIVDKELRTNIGSQARKKVIEYCTVDKMASKYELIYRRVFSKII